MRFRAIEIEKRINITSRAFTFHLFTPILENRKRLNSGSEKSAKRASRGEMMASLVMRITVLWLHGIFSAALVFTQ